MGFRLSFSWFPSHLKVRAEEIIHLLVSVNQMMLLRSSSTPLLSPTLTGNKQGSFLSTSSSGESHLKVSFPADHPSPVMLQSKHMCRVSTDSNLNLSMLCDKKEIEFEIDSPEVESPIRFLESLVKLNQVPSFSIFERDCNQRVEAKEEEQQEQEKEFTFSCPSMNGSPANKNEYNEGFGSILQEPTSLYMALGLGLGMDEAMTKRRMFDYEKLQLHYERIIEQNPGNPLMLRNYARYLYKVKGDHRKAEEFFSRAILAEPNEGEVLSEYAKLKWEIHRDKERASNYFARSIQACPQDCHVVAAYASFLWDTEESGDEQDNTQQQLTFAEAKQ